MITTQTPFRISFFGGGSDIARLLELQQLEHQMVASYDPGMQSQLAHLQDPLP